MGKYQYVTKPSRDVYAQKSLVSLVLVSLVQVAVVIVEKLVSKARASVST